MYGVGRSVPGKSRKNDETDSEKGTVEGNGAVYDQKPMLWSWRIKATLTEEFLTDGAGISLGPQGVFV